MIETKCAKCGSIAHLSRRRGLREGILHRFRGRVMFRCSHCARRWSEHFPEAAFKKARKSETFSEYIGLGDSKGQQMLLRVILITVVFLGLTAAYLGLKRPVLRVRLNEQGKSVPEPTRSRLAVPIPVPKKQ